MKSWGQRLDEAMVERGYSDRSEFTLEELLDLAKNHEMTPHEEEEQRISFAYGMLPFSNITTTREDIEKLVRENRIPHLNLVK